MEVHAPTAPDLAGRFLTALGAGLDALALRAARLVLDRTIMPAPAETAALRASAAFYTAPPFADDPRRFFAFLDEPPAAPAVVQVVRRALPLDGRRVGITFQSRYRPANPAYAAEYAAAVENATVHAELWRHGDVPRPTVVALHGFGMGHPGFDGLALMAPAFYALGLDVALLTLPLHGARMPRSARFSGQAFASPEVPRMNEAMGQSIHDLAALLAWLRARGPVPVGLLGLSLGGYVAALAAGLLDDLAFAIPVVAPVCFGDLASRFMTGSALYRRRADAAIGRDEFRAAFRVHSPLTYALRLPRERVLVVAARGDGVVPAAHTAWLRAHWGWPRTAWFTGSHLAPFGRAQLFRAVRGFLTDVGAC